MAEAPDQVVDELYGAPFDDFIARRDAAARALRKDKRRDEADAVKALRKPALSAWAIDQLVRRDRDAVDGLLAAGAALRQAKSRDALRDATHEERDAVEDLAERAAEILRDAGHPVSDKTAGELRETLHAAALDDNAREVVAAGRVVQPMQAIGLGELGGFAAAPEREKARRQEGKKRRREGEKAGPAAEEERHRRVEAARSSLREAEAGVREREQELREAEAEVAELADALEGARRDADAARAALDEARAEVERRRAALEEAEGAAE